MTNLALKCLKFRPYFPQRKFSTEPLAPSRFKPWEDPQVQKFIQDKGNRLMEWYDKVTGMDEVRMMQNRVLEAQDRFSRAQESRREMSSQLNGIKQTLREIQWELDNTTRGTDKYIQLIRREHNILQEEVVLAGQFAELERLERDSFALLCSTVRDSHEKERAQANKTRYWSIIGSIVGTVIGVAGSSMNSNYRMKQLKLLINDAIESRPTTVRLDDQSSTQLLDSIIPRVQGEINALVTRLHKQQFNPTQTVPDRPQTVSPADRIAKIKERTMGYANSYFFGKPSTSPTEHTNTILYVTAGIGAVALLLIMSFRS